MYYVESEIEKALELAKEDVSNDRDNPNCWSLAVYYERRLRENHSELEKLGISKHNTVSELLLELKEKGINNLENLALQAGFESVLNKKPLYGDIAYFPTDDGVGITLIADRNWWISSDGNVIRKRKQLAFYERRFPLIVRPLRR